MSAALSQCHYTVDCTLLALSEFSLSCIPPHLHMEFLSRGLALMSRKTLLSFRVSYGMMPSNFPTNSRRAQ